ncbi:MAG TPA: hypothetical protein VJ044_17380, partial [Candidatus Hodarchaeales archaeon]|nr:hypothetical protein [Candidatus Hodarchaeales archaeon]
MIEAIFPCRERVPIMYFLTTLFASSAFSIRNPNQLSTISGSWVLELQVLVLEQLSQLPWVALVEARLPDPTARPAHLACHFLPFLLPLRSRQLASQSVDSA